MMNNSLPAPVRWKNIRAIDRADWLQLRQDGIGGSEAAQVLGLVNYPDATPFALWMRKTGKVPLDDGQSEAAHFGTVLEQVVADEFELRSFDVYGERLKLKRTGFMYRSAENPWMLANVDRLVVRHPERGFEAKTCNAFLADEWIGGSIPDAYYCQCQHYMAVMGWELVYIACLIGGQHFVTKQVPRNNDFIKILIDREHEFWVDHVLADKAPEMIAADNPGAYSSLEPEEPDLIPASPEMESTVAALAVAKRQAKTASEAEKQLRNRLVQQIAGHSGIEGLCMWKRSAPRKHVDWRGLALDLEPTTERIKQFTTLSDGECRLTLMTRDGSDGNG